MNTAIPTQSLGNSQFTPDGSDSNSHRKISVYADGSCLKNGTIDAHAGAGILIVNRSSKRIKLKAAYLGALTNQKAEILACAIGLETLRSPCRIKLFSRSKYVVETMTGLNQMKSNREYWERLVKACLTHRIEWIWMPAKSGDSFLQAAGRLSRIAAAQREDLEIKTSSEFAKIMRLNKAIEEPAINRTETIKRAACGV